MVVLHKVNNQEGLDICLKVREEVFMIEQNISIEEEIDSFDIIDDTKVIHFYLTSNDNVVGCCRILLNGEYVKIGRVAILSKERGKGYASKMLKLVEEYFGEGHYVLEAQCYVESLYAKAGYQEIGDIFLDAGIEHIKMVKDV